MVLLVSDISSFFNPEVFSDAFTTVFKKNIGSTGVELNRFFSIIASLIVIFHFSKIAIDNLLKGGETFNMLDLKKPLFILAIVTAWPTVDRLVRELVVGGVVIYVESEQLKLSEINTDIYAKLTDTTKRLNVANEEVEANASSGVTNVFSKLYNAFTFVDDYIIEGLTKMMYNFSLGFDSLIFIAFKLISKVWLYIVGLGGPIALIVSLLSGGWSILINWFKTYLSVSLWLPVGGFILNLVNNFSLSALNHITSEFDNSISNSKALEVGNVVSTIALSGNLFSTMAVFTIFIIATKLILLAKVPQIITGWISGGNSAGGGLAAAFIPVTIAKSAGSAVATGGASATIKSSSKGLKN